MCHFVSCTCRKIYAWHFIMWAQDFGYDKSIHHTIWITVIKLCACPHHSIDESNWHKQITNEITAATPTIFDTTTGEFLELIDSHQNKLLKTLMRKQLHTCNFRCQQRTNGNNCKININFFSNRTLKKKQHTTPNKKDENITDQDMKTVMLSLTMHLCY